MLRGCDAGGSQAARGARAAADLAGVPGLPPQPARRDATQSRPNRELNDDEPGPRPSRPSPTGRDPAEPLAGADRPGAAEVADHAVQPAPLDPLHGVVAQAADLADVEDRHDVRVVQPGGRPGLVQEPPPRRGVGRRVGAQHLQRHRPVEPDVHRLVDRPHAAAAQLAHDPVAGDPLARLQPSARPRPRPSPEPAADPAHQPVDQLQALQGRAQVVPQVGVARGELLEVGRLVPARPAPGMSSIASPRRSSLVGGIGRGSPSIGCESSMR